MIRIVLAEDHEIVRHGLRNLLGAEPDLEIVGETGDGIDAVRLVERLAPDVLFTDMSMPGLNGCELARIVSLEHPGTQVVVLSMYGDESYLLEAFRNGAMAYVLKESAVEEILDALRAAVAGRRYLSPSLPGPTIERFATGVPRSPPERHDTLTTREREVLHLAAEGDSAAKIGTRLFVSRRTVESHRATMMRKLDLANQTELVRYAIRRGILRLR